MFAKEFPIKIILQLSHILFISGYLNLEEQKRNGKLRLKKWEREK